jgi:RNA polymerase sigma factor (sigma-70 family)
MSVSSAFEENSEFHLNSDFLEHVNQEEVDMHRWRWRAGSGVKSTVSGEPVYQEVREPYRANSKEVALSAYMTYAKQFRLLNQEEERELAERALKCDEQARQRLVLSNLRLVVKFARRYKDRGIDFEDLIQEGNLGLLRASQSYDPSKGTRFSTYACMWIIQFISRMVDNRARSIRLPIRVHKDIRVVKHIMEKVRMSRGSEPSLEEIVMGSKLSEARVKAAMKNMVSPLSLNQEIGIGDTSEIGDQIAYDDGVCVEAHVEEHLNQAFVSILIENLTQFESQVVLLRYGLKGTREVGFKEISERTGISLGKVKRVHASALKKMRRRAELLSRSETRSAIQRGGFALPG